MQWYSRICKYAQRPPAYLIERISDLEHAIELSKTSPSEASAVLAHVSQRLREHNDDEFAQTIDEAIQVMPDSPAKSQDIVAKVVGMMILAKDLREDEDRKKSWMSLLK